MGEAKKIDRGASNLCLFLRGITLLVVLILGAVVEVGILTSLQEHAGWIMAALLGAAGTLLAGVFAWAIPRFIHSKSMAAVLQILLLLLLIGLPGSAVKPGGISHARFGLTVLGACPIPFFDLSIRADGRVWFRNKSHDITATEVRLLADPGVEQILVATGWDGVAKVDPEAFKIPGVEVEALKTGEAVERYRELKRQGKRVAILIHSTC